MMCKVDLVSYNGNDKINQIKLARVIKAHVPQTGCQSKEQKQQRSKVMKTWGRRRKAEKASCVTYVHVRCLVFSSLDAQHVQSFLRMFIWEYRAAQFQWSQFVWNSLQSWFRRWKLMRDVDIWFLRKLARLMGLKVWEKCLQNSKTNFKCIHLKTECARRLKWNYM